MVDRFPTMDFHHFLVVAGAEDNNIKSKCVIMSVDVLAERVLSATLSGLTHAET